MADQNVFGESEQDIKLMKYFYLDMSTEQVAAYLDTIPLRLVDSQDDVPFNAQVKSYHAACDDRGDPWIVKPVPNDQEMCYHRSCLVAYLLDHATGTLAAPTTAVLIDGKRYRATKVVQKAVQISSYNYLESPFIGLLRADLVNRWIFFDEDRNPNNYLVISNSKNQPFLVAIDYDKADLCTDTMKITGMEEKFGWHRIEKTRFLTLLSPENFECTGIEEYDDRLKAFMLISVDFLRTITRLAFSRCTQNPEEMAEKITTNIINRREYVNTYFRKMFKPAAQLDSASKDDAYMAFGKSFMDMHNKKK